MENTLQVSSTQEITPIQMIMAALQTSGDLDKLKGLLELQERFEANEARKAFHKAMSEFKSIPIQITKDKLNKQYNSMYTTLGNLVNTANPELSKHGLSASWEIHENGKLSVTCKITHKLGHSEQTSLSAPPDTSGAKNPIQQIKSTITYLKSVTFESITGLASTDANVDDDGNNFPKINTAQLHTLRDLLIFKGMPESKLCEFLQIDLLENLPETQYMKAMQTINAAKKVVKDGAK